MHTLPTTLSTRLLYFVISYVLISIGIALSNRCTLPIIPTDLFPRELANITGLDYAKIKIAFDVLCLAATTLLTECFIGRLDGLGIGTILAAFTMGKAIALAGHWLDAHICFISPFASAPLAKPVQH